ncbi:MAG TPA: methylmalonyl-CoA mutase [Flavobacteriales bacterium]|nr:methylmalonyl-CoA mutase [Flavobacteriales bacterium]
MKILLSKPGLDGHDVGVKVLAHALTEAGYQVKYSGLRKSIEDIVRMAREYNADVIGLSILSGTHLILCEKMKQEMEDQKLTIPWVVGGNIPAQDVEQLIKTGASAAFATGTKIQDVVDYFEELKISI